MNRRIAISLVLMLAGAVSAVAAGSHVRYVKEHFYYHIGDEYNVVDVDVEWPEKVDGILVTPLQTWLAENLMKVEADNLTDAYRLMKARYGVPVSGPMASLPDDRKYCHVKIELKEMGHMPGKFISFAMAYTSAPAQLSSQKADTTSMLLTYDLQNERILTRNDILNTSRLKNEYNAEALANMLLAYSDLQDFGGLTSMQILSCCVVDDAILFNSLCTGDDVSERIVSAVPLSKIKTYLTKDLLKALKAPVEERLAEFYLPKTTLAGESLAEPAETAPEYPGGTDAIRQIIGENLVYPAVDKQLRVEGKVIVAMVVNEDGSVGDVAVRNMVSPTLDREAVRVVRLLRRFLPAKGPAGAVKSFVFLPIVFKLEN